ncbi:hypothetical protein NHF45_12890 [Maricaulaceae bacterium NA33B04]|nr:hypothetical protein [Maricaulaceae bacterium NA33B04]
MMITLMGLALAGLNPTAPQPMPAQYCQAEPDGPPKAMGVVTGYGLVLGERYRAGAMSQGELMAAIQRIQGVVREIAQGRPDAACALILPIETDYDLDRPDMAALPEAPVAP